jgi:hypothetical protein
MSGCVDVIVGCGGSGGWVATLLMKSPGRAPVVLVDGDAIERRNLERQLFSLRDVGHNKAQALAARMRVQGMAVEAFPEYLREGCDAWNTLTERDETIRIFCCPDNHPARMACLKLADERWVDGRKTVVAISGNEEFTADASIYLPQWKGTKDDYRVRYPETVTATAGDPLHPPCTGEAVAAQPQRALANAVAALNTAWLMELWSERIGPDTDALVIERAPKLITYGKVNMTKE